MVIFHSYVSLPEGSLLEAKSKPIYIKLTNFYSGGDQDSKTMRRCPLHPTTFCGAENGGIRPRYVAIEIRRIRINPKSLKANQSFQFNPSWLDSQSVSVVSKLKNVHPPATPLRVGSVSPSSSGHRTCSKIFMAEQWNSIYQYGGTPQFSIFNM